MLTPKQKAVLDFIESFSLERGYAPSQREIADHFGFASLGTVQNYLVRLERHGLLRKSWNAKRATEIVREPTTTESSLSKKENSLILSLNTGDSRAVPLPLLGRVAAGRPLEYLETGESIEVPSSMLRAPDGEGHFVLKVQGSSMIDDGILDGDYVVIKEQKDAERGQTVVAMVGNEATIKRFYRQGSKIELRPANENFEPILIDSLTDHQSFRIEGVLVGVIRKLAW